MIHDDNAVTALGEAVARVGRHRFPVVMTADRARVPGARSPTRSASSSTRTTPRRRSPSSARSPASSAPRSATPPTRPGSHAGYKENVIPGRATATIDCRTLPGQPELFREQLRERASARTSRSSTSSASRPLETTFDGPLVDAMAAALRAEDPGARAVPYMLSGGTDAKAFARLGIRCFGFAPLRLPADLNFAALFHGIDERVPVEGLQFGVRVLDRFLARLLTSADRPASPGREAHHDRPSTPTWTPRWSG